MTSLVPSPDPLRAELLRDLWHGGIIETQDHCNGWATSYGLTRAEFDAHVQALIDAGVAELSDDAERSPVLAEAHFVNDAPVRRLYGQLTGARACRVCGCSDAWGCDAGCWWTGPDLCSSCEDQEVRVEGTVFTQPGTRGRFLMALYDTEGGVEYVYVWPHDLTDVGPSSQDEQPAVFTDEPLASQPTDALPSALLYPEGCRVYAELDGVWAEATVVGHGQEMRRGQLRDTTLDTLVIVFTETPRVLSVNRTQVRAAPPVHELPKEPSPATAVRLSPTQPQPEFGPLFGGLQ